MAKPWKDGVPPYPESDCYCKPPCPCGKECECSLYDGIDPADDSDGVFR